MIIDDILHRNAQRYPHRVALKKDQYALTWSELEDRVNNVAVALAAACSERGERVAILMENCPAYIVLYFAIARAGLISVPLNYKLTASELNQIVEQVKPKLMICAQDYAGVTRTLVNDDNLADQYWVCHEDASLFSAEGVSVLNDDITLRFTEANENDIFSIFFTSGTTGLPKGAMVSHRNLIANAYNQLIADAGKTDDVNLIATPLYHMGAVFMAITYMMPGATQVVAKKFDALSWIDIASREHVSVALLVPTMVNALLSCGKTNFQDLASLRLIFYGGGPMHAKVLETAMRELACDFMQGYGLTETLEATFLTADDHRVGHDEIKTARLQSCGREAVGAEIKIINEAGDELPSGQHGEILIKSDSVIPGYWNQPEETANAIKKGWFYSGDIGYLDADRYLYVVDRKKDIIVSGGVNIYSKEIETVLYELDGIREVAVIGLPDEKWGEAVSAVIVLDQGKAVEASTVIDYCAVRMARYKKPKNIYFLDELPKNPSGKILKRELRSMLSST